MSVPDRDQRIYQPTPRRVQDFRKRGEIALSKDLSATATLLGGAVGLALAAPAGLDGVLHMTRSAFGELDVGATARVYRAGLSAFAGAAGPVAIGALLGFLAAAAAQLGWPPVLRGVTFDFSKIFNPGQLQQMFSPRAAAGRGLISLAKVGFVAVAAYLALRFEVARFFVQPALAASAIGVRLLAVAERIFLYAGGALAVLAAYDFIGKRRDLAAKMRMTAEEMRREMRENDGDPQMRGRRKRRMKEIAKRRISAAVKTADAVIVNPTEYAVAIRYNTSEDRAPRVVAKGRGAVAEQIRALARQAGIPILVEPPLCRLIHKLVPEGREIPSNLYRAVAEVLAYVYKLRAGRARS